jgi:hypothetical protein
MTAILFAFIGKFWPFIAGAVGLVGFGLAQRRSGARNERARQAASEAKARDVADDVQNDVGALTPKQAREALHKWSKR